MRLTNVIVILMFIMAQGASAALIELYPGESIILGSNEIVCSGEGQTNPNCSESENPYVVCLNKGYSPSSCNRLYDGCAAGQALCLEKGYSPSSCADSAGERRGGVCEVSDNPYMICLQKGYSPSSCKVLVDGCAAGQAACLNKGYSPSSCAN